MAIKQTFNPLSGNFDTISEVTLGTANGLTITPNQALSLAQATSSTPGAVANIGSALGVATLDASGLVPITQIPPAALERLVIVADQTARFALTTATVQNGDTVLQNDTQTMYFVKDDTNLNNASGYAIYTTGGAASVPWSGITGIPAPVNALLGTNTGDVTLTAVGGSPNANGASLSGQALTLQPANSSNPGLVSAAAQSFGGDKTFTGNILVGSIYEPTLTSLSIQVGNRRLIGSNAFTSIDWEQRTLITNAGATVAAWSINGVTLNNETADRAAYLNSNKAIKSSATTAVELGYVSGVTSALQTQLNSKAPLASPALTGIPTAPTAAPLTNNTQLASTAYVDAAVAAAPPAAAVDFSIPALNINWLSGDTFYKTISASSTFTFSNSANGKSISVAITNSSGSNITLTMPTVATSGTLNVTVLAGKTNVYTFIKSNGTIYAGVLADMA